MSQSNFPPQGNMRIRLLVVFMCLSLHAWSQEREDSYPLGHVLGEDGTFLINAAYSIACRPLHWGGSEWLLAGEVAAGTGLASTQDVAFHRILDRNQNPTNDHLSDIVVVYGDGRYMFSLGVGMYLAGLFTGDHWIRQTGLLATGAMLFCGVFSTAVKIGVGRARPFVGLGNHWFQPFRFLNDDVHSFPSGHTVVAFAMSTVLSRRIANIWASIGLYALASATALSRTYTSEHWLSDVVFGAASATMISNSLVSWFDGAKNDDVGAFHVLPYAGGVSIVLTF